MAPMKSGKGKARAYSRTGCQTCKYVNLTFSITTSREVSLWWQVRLSRHRELLLPGCRNKGGLFGDE